MVVSSEARRAGQGRVKTVAISPQWLIQLRRFRAEQSDGRQRRERGELSRPTIIGDQQRGAMEHRQQMAHRLGIASQIDTRRILAVIHHGLRDFPVALHADYADRIAFVQQSLTQL